MRVQQKMDSVDSATCQETIRLVGSEVARHWVNISGTDGLRQGPVLISN